jgi:uncharacterized protein (DUF1330 family)
MSYSHGGAVNTRWKISLAVIVGVVMGVAGIEIARAAAKPPAYLVVEYEITDAAGFKTYVQDSNAIKSSRVFLARHANGTPLSGEPPKWIGILEFPSVEDALAYDASPEYTELKANRDKSTKWRSFVVEGVQSK